MNKVKFITSIILLATVVCIIYAATGLPLQWLALSFVALALIASRNKVVGVAMFTLTSIGWTQGSQNLGGIVGDIYYAPVEDILTFPTLASAGALKTANASNFVMKTGKKFISIYHTAETGKADSNTVGERDGRSMESLLEFIFPGSKQEVKEFKRFALNTPCVVIYKNTNGQFEIIGVVNLDETTTVLTGDIPAYLEAATYTTGDARSSRRGTTFQFKQPGSPHDPVIYVGSIPLTPAA